MGAQTTAMFVVAAREATQDAGVQDARLRARCPTRLEVQCQWARTLVECRGQAHDRCFIAKVLHSTRAGLVGGNPPATPVFNLNRRMRSRTYGGVRGLRGQLLTLLDACLLALDLVRNHVPQSVNSL